MLARIVKSLHNRAQPLVMRARGGARRALMPSVLEGGRGLAVGKGVALVIYGELVVGQGVVLSDGCALEVGPRGRLVLGDGVFVGRHTVIASQERVEIGAGALIAEHCSIRDMDHHVDADERRREVEAVTSPVSLGASVWIGAGVRVLRGGRVGDGSVIAANSVVRGEIPAGVVAAGIPAKVVRTIASRAV